MGLDCYSQIIVGSKLTRVERKKETTRYDEETGNPYQKTIIVERWLFEDGAKYLGSFENDENLYRTGCNNNILYLGYLVAETKSHRHEEPAINLDSKFMDIISLKEGFLKVYGKEAGLYLITVLSY